MPRKTFVSQKDKFLKNNNKKFLKLSRFFTKKGVHPYDEVKWIKTNADIPGSNFKMEGVEFPDFYSQNAINVIASKYFKINRGKQEKSLKELINRVVQTFKKWGLEQGYFDEENAKIFEDELTYILLHQLAVFNSPVWFNVGVEGRRQQCSACQPYRALISTPYGFIPIGEIVRKNLVGLPVYDSKGITYVIGVKNNGFKEVYKIYLKSGQYIEATGDHLVKTSGFNYDRSGNKYKWIRVDELKAGMRLYIHNTKVFNNINLINLNDYLQKNYIERAESQNSFIATITNTKTETTTESILEQEAALVGWLQGDGFVGKYDKGTNKSFIIEFMAVNEDQVNYLIPKIEKVFNGVHYKVRKTYTKNGKLIWRIRLYGDVLRDFICRYKLLDRREKMRVPQMIFSSDEKTVCSYLRSFFDCEGYVSFRRNNKNSYEQSIIGAATISEDLMRDIQILLSGLGIFSRLNMKKDKRLNRLDIWEIKISYGNAKRVFYEKIGFITREKQIKLEYIINNLRHKNCSYLRNEEIVKIEKIGVEEVYDIQTLSGEYLTNNICVHNCFILDVEDDMESILDWIKIEGMVFKGGSGSGINLSKLRAKGEKLSAGGSSSGVISFMKAADAVAGSIKCVHKDTELITENGVKKIWDIKEGEKVLTRYGFKEVGKIYNTGKKDLYKLTTELGIEVIASPEHKFLVRTKYGGVWKELKELTPDDYLVVDLSPKFYGEYQKLEKIDLEHFNEKPIKIPDILDDKFAEWLGLLFGDGNITDKKYTHYIGFQVDARDKDLIKYIIRLSKSLFGVHSFIHKRKDKKDNSVSVRVASHPLIRFLEKNGLYKGYGDKIRVPEKIKNSPYSVRAAFLRGYFESDGTVSIKKPYPNCSSINKEFIDDIHELLLSLGIVSKKFVIHKRINSFGKKPIYRILITSSFGIKRFYEKINFISRRKRRKFAKGIEILNIRPFEQRWILPYFEEEFENLYSQMDNQYKYAFRRATSKYFRETTGKTNFNRFRALYLLERFPFLENTFIAELANKDIYYDQIETIEYYGKEETYDIFVPEVNEYLIKGIVTHNSGGTTRRAAKMVVLNADHPEIMDFIRVKAEEENKVRALIEAGYDMSDLNNPLWQNIFFQNANNSIRVTDEFMKAAEEDKEWTTYYRTTKKPAQTYKAKEILWEAAKAAWECGDPGVQFHDTVNRWNTCKNSGEIVATNPCVTGETLIATNEGWRRIKDLVGKNPILITHQGEQKAIKVWKTGTKPVYKIITRSGYELRATEDHPIYIEDKGDVLVKDLQKGDKIVLIGAGFGKGHLEKEVALMIGYALGDGKTRMDANDITRMDANEKNYSFPTKYPTSRQATLRKIQTEFVVASAKESVHQIISQYAILDEGSERKRFTDRIFNLDKESIRYILKGLFTADGTITGNPQKGFYIGLDSSSLELLKQVQLLLLNFGIKAKIYQNRRKALESFLPDSERKLKKYKVKQLHSLRIIRSSRIIFEREIGFYEIHPKQEKLQEINKNYEAYKDYLVDEIKEIIYDGVEDVYDLSEPVTQHFVANGILVHNCSEYNWFNWTSCNLASINLLKFLKEDGTFDIPAFKHTAKIIFLAQDILITPADYPHPKIAEETKKYRTIGLGYTNLGALIMALGLPYDSDPARGLAGAITSLMNGVAYNTSSEIAEVVGTFPEYDKNVDSFLEVMEMHRDESYKVKSYGQKITEGILKEANKTWDEVIERGKIYGFRNAQASVLAPAGTISFFMDCDTTGIEPDFALVKMKQLVGGGWMKIVNNTVSLALKKLGYSEKEIQDIIHHLQETQNIETAPHLKPEHLSIFDCAVNPPGGQRSISLDGHLKMVAAVQPFISGAISKTFNMPNSATIEDVYNAYLKAWKLGIKCFAIYRDGSKATQALYTQKSNKRKETLERKKLPMVRQSETHKFSVAGHEGYLTYGMFEDGSLGEIFIKMSKQGSTLAGLLDAFAIAVSIALQYGVPLKELVGKFIYMRFEPMGITNNQDIAIASSIIDYIFKYLAYRFLSAEELKDLGLEIKEKFILQEHPKLIDNNFESVKVKENGNLAGPPCKHCGGMTTRTGSCYTCIECGESSGGCG